MPQCYLCQGIGEAKLDPCPNDPPCKPYDVCGYQVTDCYHKENTVEVPVMFVGKDQSYSTTMLLTSLPKNGTLVRFTDAYRTWGKRREWKTARCVGAEIDCWGDPYYLLNEDLTDAEEVQVAG